VGHCLVVGIGANPDCVGKLRADFIGASRTGLLSTKRPVSNRLETGQQDAILPHSKKKLDVTN